MTNPYVPPGSGFPDEESTSGFKNWNLQQWSTTIASGIAVVALSFISLALIAQALRLDSESAGLPSRLRAGHASTANSSWIGGIAAIVGILLNTCGLVFVRKNKLVVPIALLAVTVIGMIAIAIIFKPS